MKLKKRYVLLAVAVIAVLGIMSVPNKPTHQWVWIGVRPADDFASIPYRLIETKQESSGEIIGSTNPDLTSLILEMQRGQGRGKGILLPIYSSCYAPDVRDGNPSVLCKTRNGADVYITSTDNVREVLLSLTDDKRFSVVKGLAVRLHASTPMILVIDSMAKRAGN